jgi:hypothetical protein
MQNIFSVTMWTGAFVAASQVQKIQKMVTSLRVGVFQVGLRC